MRYEFLFDVQVSDTVLAAFPELKMTRSPGGGTALYGPVRDEADLMGLLTRFANMGLKVIEMRRLPDAVYIVDQVARGRSAHWNEYYGAVQPSRLNQVEERFVAPERFPVWP